MFRKILCLILIINIIIAFGTSIATKAETSSPDLIFGDLNSDNNINAEDALEVLKYSAKIIGDFGDEIKILADVDADNQINASDALLILKYAAHMINSFPCENIIVPTETPVPTATPIPTKAPVLNPDEAVNITVKSLNEVATSEGNELTFTTRKSHDDGVEMNNPFSLYEITDGITISFWYTPAIDITDIYANTTILTFVHEEKAQIIKFDMEGSYQYADGKSFINYWDPNYQFIKDTTYFMTCVISSSDIKYYANGEPIPITQSSMISTTQARANLLPLVTDSGTRLYVGGTDNIWWKDMATLATHNLPSNTKVSDLKAYMKPMTMQEVKELYNLNNSH